MHTLRELRNYFAHHPAHADFSNDEAKRLFAKLELTKELGTSETNLRTICLVAVASCLFAVGFGIRTESRPVVPAPPPEEQIA